MMWILFLIKEMMRNRN